MTHCVFSIIFDSRLQRLPEFYSLLQLPHLLTYLSTDQLSTNRSLETQELD
jgi:hypothetical protein